MPEKKINKTAAAETLLVELLTEELPPKALQRLSQVFCDVLTADLHQDGLLAEPYQAKAFSTPRRLAISITNVLAKAPDKPVEIQGPSLKVGLDAEDKPTQALVGFAKKNGVAVDELIQIDTPKGKVFACRKMAIGSHLETNLELKIAAALEGLPIPKLMRWGAGEAKFARPVHGLVMLHGTRVVSGEVLGVSSSNKTLGHRFLSSDTITLKHADDYERVLHDNGKVIADFAARRSEISRQFEKAAGSAKLVMNDALLDEITSLVEAPAVYGGEFSTEFLTVPEECLILSMQQHQKYVPLRDKATGKLLPRFLFVSNIETKQPREIIHGNERVLRARLSDAKFFYDQDRKTRLESRVPRLANVVYHNKLGGQLERIERIKKLAGTIARELKADVASAERAAYLCKADLLTDMVGEFPELQGTMGRYYALNDGEPRDVADAIEQHYRPRFAGDILPEGPIACAVALADKLEVIAGMFGIGQQPTGDKDPFGLRRAALGVTRILVEKKLELPLLPLVDSAIDAMPKNAKSDWLVMIAFLLERTKSYFQEQGFSLKAIEGVIVPFGHLTPLHTLSGMVLEASKFLSTEEGRILADANKRITNILKKSGFEVPFGVSPDSLEKKPNTLLFEGEVEIAFWTALQKIGGESLAFKKNKNFAQSLRTLSQLGQPTKAFFDNVMVNADQPDVRDNRITLLQHARAYMNQVADLSLMAS